MTFNNKGLPTLGMSPSPQAKLAKLTSSFPLPSDEAHKLTGQTDETGSPFPETDTQ